MNKEKVSARGIRFRSRVKIEREILTIVNTSSVAEKVALAGMSFDAIQQWEKSVLSERPNARVGVVVSTLYRIAQNANIISDNNRMVFAEGKYFDTEQFNLDKIELEEQIASSCI